MENPIPRSKSIENINLYEKKQKRKTKKKHKKWFFLNLCFLKNSYKLKVLSGFELRFGFSMSESSGWNPPNTPQQVFYSKNRKNTFIIFFYIFSQKLTLSPWIKVPEVGRKLRETGRIHPVNSLSKSDFRGPSYGQKTKVSYKTVYIAFSIKTPQTLNKNWFGDLYRKLCFLLISICHCY